LHPGFIGEGNKMIYRAYGNSGVIVSALGFGCMRLPEEGEHVKTDVAVELLRKAMGLGVTYFDSAVGYCHGESEATLGKSIAGRAREKLVISTKNPDKSNDPARWRAHLDTSLKRLDTDYIDFYHFHGLTWSEYSEHLQPYGTMDEAHRAKDEGLVRHLSFSCHDAPGNIKKLIDTGEFAGMLVQYNLLDRRNEEAISYAHEHGLGVAIMGPVGGGRLVQPSEVIGRMISDAKSTAEVALRFVLSNTNVTLALSGMDSINILEENVATASRAEPLNTTQRQEIDAILEQISGMSECTGCGYCGPCPNGVDIPTNFTALNLLRAWGLRDLATSTYVALGKRKKEDSPAPAWAEACVECGDCVSTAREPPCPQHIDIPERLKEVADALFPTR